MYSIITLDVQLLDQYSYLLALLMEGHLEGCNQFMVHSHLDIIFSNINLGGQFFGQEV